MAKFCGAIGFVDTVETAPGVYEEKVTERKYYGDLVRNIRRLQAGDQLNDNIIPKTYSDAWRSVQWQAGLTYSRFSSLYSGAETSIFSLRRPFA